MNAKELTDSELLAHASAETRFHRDHVRRMYELAGEPVPDGLWMRRYWYVWPETMGPLLKKARAR